MYVLIFLLMIPLIFYRSTYAVFVNGRHRKTGSTNHPLPEAAVQGMVVVVGPILLSLNDPRSASHLFYFVFALLSFFDICKRQLQKLP